MAPRGPADEVELAERLAAATREDVPVALTGAAWEVLDELSGRYLEGWAAGEVDAQPGGQVEVLSLGASSFRGLASLEPEEGRVTVRAGTRLVDLASELAAAGQWLPAAASAFRGSVGGLVARASPGPFDARYGGVQRHLLSAWTITHLGRTLRWGRGVMKDVAGYDVKALWCGSRGRLGALTVATFRSWALPAERRAYRFPSDAAAAVSLAVEPDAWGVRPDGIRWDWNPDAGGMLDVWLLGSAASVEERARALLRWAEDRGLRDPEVELALTPTALAAGGAVTGRTRHPGEAVLRLQAEPDRLVSLGDGLRRAAGEAALGLEALPGAGVVWLGYRREELAGPHGRGSLSESVERLLEQARQAAPELAVAVERGGPEEHAAATRRRSEAVRTLEEAVLEALHGRPRHWLADYV